MSCLDYIAIYFIWMIYFSFLDVAALWLLHLQYYVFWFFFLTVGIRTSLYPSFSCQCLLSIATLSHCFLHFTIFPHPVLRTACVLGEPSKLWDSPEGCERAPVLQGWGRNFTACISLMQSLQSLWLGSLGKCLTFQKVSESHCTLSEKTAEQWHLWINFFSPYMH